MDLKKLEDNIKQKLSEINYELYSLKFHRDGSENYLSIVVDRVEPIDMDAIVEVTHYLNDYLDANDPIEEKYCLDISSLGAEKPLKIESLDKYVNSYIHIHLINPIDGENIYEGNLDEVNEDKIKLSFKIKTRTKTIEVIKTNISAINLAIKF